MPNYFADYDTTVTFITAEELATEHAGIPHGGSVIRRGHTSEDVAETVSFELQLGSNPEFTGLGPGRHGARVRGWSLVASPARAPSST